MEAAEGDLEFEDGAFRVVGTDKAIPLTEVAKAFYAPMGPMTERWASGWKARHLFDQSAKPSERLACLRDRDGSGDRRGEGRPLFRGRRSRPRAEPDDRARADHGGVAQGIGQALYEHAIYDRDTAQMSAASWITPCRAPTSPEIETQLEEVPSKTNPLGVKGIGESGTIGAPPAVINAILDALKPARGRTHRHAGDGGARCGTRSRARRGRRGSGRTSW